MLCLVQERSVQEHRPATTAEKDRFVVIVKSTTNTVSQSPGTSLLAPCTPIILPSLLPLFRAPQLPITPDNRFIPNEPACCFCSLLGLDRERDEYANHSSTKSMNRSLHKKCYIMLKQSQKKSKGNQNSAFQQQRQRDLTVAESSRQVARALKQ